MNFSRMRAILYCLFSVAEQRDGSQYSVYCNVKPKPSSHISGLGSRSWPCDLGLFVLRAGSSVSGPGFWILDLRSKVSGPGPWVLVHSIIVTKCDKKLLQSVTSIIK